MKRPNTPPTMSLPLAITKALKNIPAAALTERIAAQVNSLLLSGISGGSASLTRRHYTSAGLAAKCVGISPGSLPRHRAAFAGYPHFNGGRPHRAWEAHEFEASRIGCDVLFLKSHDAVHFH